MLFQLAPPSKNAGKWIQRDVGSNMTGIRVDFIVFESGEEIKECASHPRWFANLAHCFYLNRAGPDYPTPLLNLTQE